MCQTIWGSNPDKGKRFTSSTKCPDCLCPPSLLFSVFQRALSPGQWPGHEADYSTPSSADFKNKWGHTSTLPICLLSTYRKNFTVTKRQGLYSHITLFAQAYTVHHRLISTYTLQPCEYTKEREDAKVKMALGTVILPTLQKQICHKLLSTLSELTYAFQIFVTCLRLGNRAWDVRENILFHCDETHLKASNDEKSMDLEFCKSSCHLCHAGFR